MTLRVAQFFLKIAHLSFSMGPRGPHAYGLRPRLWLLITSVTVQRNFWVHNKIHMLRLGSFSFIVFPEVQGKVLGKGFSVTDLYDIEAT